MKNWRQKLLSLKNVKQWDAAIEFMMHVLNDYPNDLDAHLNMLYLLMNLLVEEDYDDSKFDYYQELCLQYFNDSYKKFHENSEYLFYAGTIAFMSEWFFGIESQNAEEMIEKAKKLEPNNMIYKWAEIYSHKNPLDPSVQACAQLIFQKNSPLRKTLEQKGSLGMYFLDCMENWATEILAGKTAA